MAPRHLSTDDPLERAVWTAYEDLLQGEHEDVDTDALLAELKKTAPKQIADIKQRAEHEGLELACQRYDDARQQHKTTFAFYNAHADAHRLER
jgi:hypothetical protein